MRLIAFHIEIQSVTFHIEMQSVSFHIEMQYRWERYETDCISHWTNTFEKGMNPIILPPAMGK